MTPEEVVLETVQMFSRYTTHLHETVVDAIAMLEHLKAGPLPPEVADQVTDIIADLRYALAGATV